MMPAPLKRRKEFRGRSIYRSIHERYCNDVTPLHIVTPSDQRRKGARGPGRAAANSRPGPLLVLPFRALFGVLSNFYQRGASDKAKTIEGRAFRDGDILITYQVDYGKRAPILSPKLPTKQGKMSLLEVKMELKQAKLPFTEFSPLEARVDDLMKSGKVEDLIALPEPVFNVAMERVRRAHLEKRGVRFLDPHNPATCETCEG